MCVSFTFCSNFVSVREMLSREAIDVPKYLFSVVKFVRCSELVIQVSWIW